MTADCTDVRQRPSVRGRLAERVLSSKAVSAAARRRQRQSLRVLAYHGVDDVQSFALHLEHLVRSYRVLDWHTARRVMLGQESPPARGVLITFDDGEVSLVREGLEALQRFDLPAVAFLVAGVLGTEEPYWWVEVKARLAAGATSARLGSINKDRVVRHLKAVPDTERLAVIDDLRRSRPDVTVKQEQLTEEDVRRLHRSGVAIGGHSWSHPCFDRCSPAKVREELVVARRKLVDIVGDEPVAFAYPNGGYDHRTPALVRSAGYEVAFAFDHRIAHPGIDDPLTFPRLRVDSTSSLRRLEMFLNGAHPAVHHRVLRRA